jgi:hypothetical protein
MAKLSAHNEIFRFLASNGSLRAYCSDGKVLYRRVGGGWKVRGTIKPDRTPAQAAENVRQAFIAKGEGWRLRVKSLPSMATLERWMSEDGGCETVTGDWVEPDGVGPDGAPSWLRALCMI